MRALIAWSLDYPVLVIALAVALLAGGLYTADHAAYDAFPEFAPPRVEVQTEGPGLAAEEIEHLVTIPLENAFNGITGLETLRSSSVLGLSSVQLLFGRGTDLLQARNLVQERLELAASRLPASVRRPVILQPMSSTSRAMKLGVRSDSLTRMELSELVEWTIRPRLLAIAGVANVAVWGQRTPELQVQLDPERLLVAGVAAAEVVAAARRATALDAGGFVDTPNQRFAVQVGAAIHTPADLAAMPVRQSDAGLVRIGDVAEVRWDHAPPIGDAIIDDVPGLLLIVEKLPWGNTLAITRDVEAAIAELRPGLGDVHVDTTVFRPATFIADALGNLGGAMLLGCGLVVLILLAFLFDLRAACISLIAIPLSISAAVVLLHGLGGSINTMTLAGLVIALGEVVDDAIIDVENIGRRLAIARAEGSKFAALGVVLRASLEVRSAVVFGSLVIVLVFLPVFFLDGLPGAFFRPLGIAYVTAIAASLLVALTVTPALCLLLLPRRVGGSREAPVVRALTRVYRRLLPAVIGRPRLTAAIVALALLAAGLAAGGLRREFLPHFRERDFLMHWVEKPGTGIAAMARITERVSRELRAIPGVRNFGSHIGRAEFGDEVVGPNFTELWLSVDPEADYDATLAAIQEVVDGYPGLQRDVLTYLRERVKEVLSGAGASIVVRVRGPELAALQRSAAAVAAAIGGVPGIADLHVEQQQPVPRVAVELRPEALALSGLDPQAVRSAIALLLRGATVGELQLDQRARSVVVTGDPELRRDPGQLRELLLELPGGGRTTLGEVADVAVLPTPNVVKRDGASRKIDITCNVRDADLGTVATAIAARVAATPLPLGCHSEVLGEFAAREAAQARLLWLALVAVLAVLLLLHADFRSLRLTALVAVTLPFALIGGVLGAYADTGALSLGSLVGFVTVLGIAARNGIMLVSHYRHLETVENVPFGRELVLRGAAERLSPILMTALSAGLALLPLVVGEPAPGNEIERPMAFVILGGLVSSTALNLLVLPALYGRWGRRPTS
ncbi:MAG: efflux RND transporter permease subunit [Planctomycetes bacterium]|nr:efflux RND transporter permease subunit [Planctomycetota bacterium]